MAKPKRIVLIRHGNSAANADKSVRATIPDHRIPLTEQGHRDAKDAGVRLKELFGKQTIQVYLSPYLRTRETYEGLKLGAEYELNIVKEYEDPRIREQDFGHLRALEAFALIDAERSAFGTFYYRIPDGESGADVYDRVTTFLDTMYRDFEKQDYAENALIVSHGLTIRLLLMRWLHWSVEKFEKLKNPFNCEHFTLLLGDDGKYHLQNQLREYTDEESEAYKNSGGRKPWMA
jgi:broad specificity phosphatase PhoE